MSKKISVYELLGLIKDGKAPKKIKWKDEIYTFVYKDTINEDYDYQDKYGSYLLLEFLKYNYLTSIFITQVEILEEDKPIIEKIKNINNVSNSSDLIALRQMQWENNNIFETKLNEIIEFLSRKEDK